MNNPKTSLTQKMEYIIVILIVIIFLSLVVSSWNQKKTFQIGGNQCSYQIFGPNESICIDSTLSPKDAEIFNTDKLYIKIWFRKEKLKHMLVHVSEEKYCGYGFDPLTGIAKKNWHKINPNGKKIKLPSPFNDDPEKIREYASFIRSQIPK